MTPHTELTVIYKGRAIKRWAIRVFVGSLYIGTLLFLVVKGALSALESHENVSSLLAAVFLFVSFGYLFALSCWSLWLVPRLVTRVSWGGSELIVERMFGQWRGHIGQVRLRKGARPPAYKWVRYRLELADGRGIGEIVMHWPGEEQQKEVESLRDILSRYGAGEAMGVSGQAPLSVGLRLRHALSGVIDRQRWFARFLFYAWLVSGYAALVVGGARWREFGLVSLLSLGVVLAEVPFVIAALPAVQSGKTRGRGLESALKLLQIGWACFVVSVFWDWLVGVGHSWLVVLLLCVYGAAITLELVVPGSVFAPFSPKGADKGGPEALSGRV